MILSTSIIVAFIVKHAAVIGSFIATKVFGELFNACKSLVEEQALIKLWRKIIGIITKVRLK